jgi:S-adenosylmethionine synthetase
MNVLVTTAADAPGDRPGEVVERKGCGHPDTICDALAEEVSRALCRHYLDRFGVVLHHNVDKALLCGGASEPRFGAGEVTVPIEIDLAGRATDSFRGETIPTTELAVAACRAWLRANLPALDIDRHVRLRCRFRSGSQDLVELFARSATSSVPVANDTSIGVGFAPLSPLEDTVLAIEDALTGADGQARWPEAGKDVKVMAVRQGAEVALTVACAFVSRFVHDLDDYFEKKARIAGALEALAHARLGAGASVVLNGADDRAGGSVYLTVTGTSAEAGDDGEVGRGNRVGGLITPGRMMTIEAAAGKNPVTHVGKVYNVAAGLIAEEIVRAVAGVRGAECLLVSRIGARVDEPQAVMARLVAGPGWRPDSVATIEGIARDVLGRWRQLSERLIAGQYRLY